MAQRTYISTTEAAEYFPLDSDYTAAQRASALNRSFGLVNSFISRSVSIPELSGWDGETSVNAPEVLKQCQAEFYRYVLQSSNDGASDELTDAYNATVDKLRGIQEGDLSLPSQIYEHQSGWHITEKDTSQDKGDLYISGPSPLFKRNYKFIITASGYPAALTYDVYSDEQLASIESHTGSYDSETTIDSSFSVRFVGYWDVDDEIHIVGIPSSEINESTTEGPKITQGDVAFGYSQFITRGP